MTHILGALLAIFLFHASLHAADRVRIPMAGFAGQFMTFPLAQKRGFLKEEGVEAEIIRISAAAGRAALSGGEVNYSTGIGGASIKMAAPALRETLCGRRGLAMKKITLKNYATDKYYPKIVKTVDAELQSRNFVTPIAVFISTGLLERRDVEDWRAGRIRYLEQVVRSNLAKASRILRILRFYAHDLNLKPSMTVYKRKTGGEKNPLRFSKSGERNIEEGYARHFVRLGKAAVVNALSAEHVIDARAKSEL